MSIEFDRAELERLAGKVIVAGFEGREIPQDLQEAISKGAMGGLVLFSRNIESPEQVASMLAKVRADAPIGESPLVAVDQEGGRVVRLKEPLTVLPPMRRFGELNDVGTTELAGRIVGLELASVGVTVNFAPVLDVDTNPESPIIGDRSFGDTPELVLRHALAFGRGLKDGGVAPCGKHFPGHGDASVDSHVSLPRVSHDADRLRRVELEPFIAWARTGLGALMTAHVLYPALDEERPASTSRKIIGSLLRDELHFKRAVFSDDLEMGAVGEFGGAAHVAVESIRAGVDGLLVCRSADVFREVREALIAAASEDPGFARKLIVAGTRLAPMGMMPRPRRPFEWLGSVEHRKVQSELLLRLQKR